jgi:EmrB/QacA subfamily drug resistance transporter
MTTNQLRVPTPAAEPREERRRWAGLALLCLAFGMVILDVAIVTVALPSIKVDLGFSQSDLSWVASAYGITYGALLLLGGRVADLVGRRSVFMAGVLLFAASSLACGLAWDPGILIAARVTQGLGAALLTPAALSLIMTTFPEGADRNKALGAWSAVGGLGGSAGLILGGVLTDTVGWEWMFYVNVPVGLAVLALSPLLLRDSRDPTADRRLDTAGALTITAGLALLTYAIVEAPDRGWDAAATIATLAAAAVLLAAFIAIEATSRRPLMPLRIFRIGSLSGANLLGLLTGMATFSVFIIGTLYLQQVLGYSPLESGLAFLAASLPAVGFAFVAQALATRVGLRLVGLGGMALLGSGIVLLADLPVDGSYLGDLLPGLILFGGGISTSWVAATIGALAGVPAHQGGLASGLINTAQQVGGALGIAILATVAVQHTTALLAGGVQPLVALSDGFQRAYLLALVFPAIGALAALLFLKPAPNQAPGPVALEGEAS